MSSHNSHLLRGKRAGASYVCIVAAAAIMLSAQAEAQTPDSSDKATILSKENIVDAAGASGAWAPASIGQALAIRDRVRTGEDSRAAVRLSDASVLRVDELTETEILAPQQAGAKPTVDLKQGSAYFFSREKSREVQVQTPAANGAIRGTEFAVTVAANGQTRLTMIDGEVELSNAQGSLLVRSGERAEVDVGGKPRKTAVIEAINSIQWCLYYPGVLDLNDLQLSPGGRSTLLTSLSAYRDGDLLKALETYPKSHSAGSSAEKVYRAGLFLVVGQVPKAERLLRDVNRNAPGREALSTLIAAVTLKDKANRNPTTPSDWVAESYYRQSRADLRGALQAARRATEIDPSFGFAWTRVAELQFSFGRVPASREALEKGLGLAPRNPSAHALRGFLYSADNRMDDAKKAFEDAIAIDSALGNAWLGHGLSLVRQGQAEAGRRDLQAAAVLEPNRAIFHSYLGKAFSNVGNNEKATKELDRAKQIDPHDPTPWVYSAIENRQNSRVNEAVRDLEKSIELNDNRRIYRSQFLLDQDRAVRSANLAAIYQEDGMEDVSVREATRGVDSDYSNASSHLFLANSYNALRDPNRINLRYETPWFNELLLANLLAPVGGGPLSQYVSEQEYSKLFEANRLGISSTSTYLSSGAFRETASQFGILGNFSYSLDTEYQYDPGQRPNNEITRSESYAQAKVQITPRDSIFLQTKYQDTRQGDLIQRYDQRDFEPGAHFRELQQPAIILAGYHHEWAPGIHTLLLAGRLADEISFSDLNRAADVTEFERTGFRPNVSRSVVFTRGPTGDVTGAFVIPLDLRYHSSFTTYTGELNQIWETDQNTLVAGARLQSGEFHTSDRLDNAPPFAAPFFDVPAAAQDFNTSLERESFYLYDTWRPIRSLSITGGVSFDRLTYPTDYRNAPITPTESTRSKVSPKAGVIWNPTGHLVVRAAYTQSLGGVSFDESVQLEPNQVAGFNQVFRSIISESIAGSVAAPTYENAGVLIEDKFPSGTYVAAQATLLRSNVDRRIGSFDAFVNGGRIDPPIVASSTPQHLDYEEQSLLFTVNQMLGDEWSLGGRYQLTFSNLETVFSEIPSTVSSAADSRQKATLHTAQLFALYNHPSGFFGRAEAYWARQSNVGYQPDTPGDELFQFNVYAGYRFRRNFGDVTVGLLNLSDQDYQLNPLSTYNELPRDRTLFVRLRLNF
jgi:tetratricopeptide (TPR) repeat protein/ferric-dicitrate binding protein FerR (iron transport regulator)